jgi:hypothetical protein
VSDERFECVKCGRIFIWSSGEQRFYHERGLSRPKHCPNCRSQRRADRQSGMRGLVGPPRKSMFPPSQPAPPRVASPSIFEKIRAFLKRLLS